MPQSQHASPRGKEKKKKQLQAKAFPHIVLLVFGQPAGRESEPARMDLDQADRSSEPARRASEPAEMASKPAVRALEPALRASK